MFANKKKKKSKSIIEKEDEDTIQSMRSWVRKIEQSTNSIGSRLSAVEKRITRGAYGDDNDFITIDSAKSNSLTKAIVDLNNDNEDFEKLVKILGNELAILHEDLASQQNEISLFNEKVDDLRDRFSNIKEEIQKTLEYEEQVFNNINERIRKIENRAPPVMKLGNMEVPIEIAGIIAGGIALVAAFLIIINQKSFLVSPMFLALVGIVFIGAVLLKTIKTTRANRNIAPKTVFTAVKEQ